MKVRIDVNTKHLFFFSSYYKAETGRCIKVEILSLGFHFGHYFSRVMKNTMWTKYQGVVNLSSLSQWVFHSIVSCFTHNVLFIKIQIKYLWMIIFIKIVKEIDSMYVFLTYLLNILSLHKKVMSLQVDIL